MFSVISYSYPCVGEVHTNTPRCFHCKQPATLLGPTVEDITRNVPLCEQHAGGFTAKPLRPRARKYNRLEIARHCALSLADRLAPGGFVEVKEHKPGRLNPVVVLTYTVGMKRADGTYPIHCWSADGVKEAHRMLHRLRAA